MKPSYDFVIIGSGFGGSVSAYRLTAEQLRLGKPAHLGDRRRQSFELLGKGLYSVFRHDVRPLPRCRIHSHRQRYRYAMFL